MGVSISIGGGYNPRTKIGKLIVGIVTGLFAIGFFIGAIFMVVDAFGSGDSHLRVCEEFDVDGELVGYNQYAVSVTGELENTSDEVITIDCIRILISSSFDADEAYVYGDFDTITLTPGQVYVFQELDLDADDVLYTDIEEIEYRILGESDFHEVREINFNIGSLIAGIFLGIGGFVAMVSAIIMLVSALKKKSEPVAANGWTGGVAGTTRTYNGNVVGGAAPTATKQSTHVVCQYCGTKNDKSATKCSGCGARL